MKERWKRQEGTKKGNQEGREAGKEKGVGWCSAEAQPGSAVRTPTRGSPHPPHLCHCLQCRRTTQRSYNSHVETVFVLAGAVAEEPPPPALSSATVVLGSCQVQGMTLSPRPQVTFTRKKGEGPNSATWTAGKTVGEPGRQSRNSVKPGFSVQRRLRPASLPLLWPGPPHPVTLSTSPPG